MVETGSTTFLAHKEHLPHAVGVAVIASVLSCKVEETISHRIKISSAAKPHKLATLLSINASSSPKLWKTRRKNGRTGQSKLQMKNSGHGF